MFEFSMYPTEENTIEIDDLISRVYLFVRVRSLVFVVEQLYFEMVKLAIED